MFNPAFLVQAADSVDKIINQQDKVLNVVGPTMGFMSITFLMTCGIIVVSFIVMVASLAFTIMMIVDCSKREFKDQQLWLIIMIIGLFVGYGLIAAILYYFLVTKAK